METINAEQVNYRAKLIMHRLYARVLLREPERLDGVLADVATHRPANEENARDDDEWKALLASGADAVCRAIVARGERMDRLRSTSPLPCAGILDLTDPGLRRRIWRKARLEMPGATRPSLETFHLENTYSGDGEEEFDQILRDIRSEGFDLVSRTAKPVEQ